MENIVKSNTSLSLDSRKLIDSSNMFDLEVGKYLIDDTYNYIYKVIRIYEEEDEVWVEIVKVNLEGEKVGDKEFHKFNDIINHSRYSCILPDTPVKYVDSIKDSIFEKELEEEVEESNSTDLAIRSDVKMLELRKKELLRKSNMLEAKRRMLKYLMEGKKQELERKREVMMKVVDKIQHVIYTIELYLGVNEQVHQIKKGNKSSFEEPIYLHQQLLFMDEEVGVIEGGGLDFQNIDKFDEWVVKEKNLNKILPNNKGVVALRIRREDKEYKGYDPLLKAQYNDENMHTYFLIRNGECVYRIWANMVVYPRLFPLRLEIQKLYDEYKRGEFESDKEKFEKKVFKYQKNILVLQGLVERTEIFTPLPFEEFNLFKPESYGEYVKFVYDDELTIGQGRKLFKDWHRELNSKIRRGSRILFCNDSNIYDKSYIDDRFFTYYSKDNLPSSPTTGVYTVEVRKSVKRVQVWEEGFINHGKPKKDKDGNYAYKIEDVNEYYIQYNPKDEVRNTWDYWDTGHIRKNRISFIIFLNDEFIFNYDLLDLSDIEFYLESRVDRKNYLHMMPILINLRQLRLKELEWENEFVKSMRDRMSLDLKFDRELIEKKIWECVEWWKGKVIWRRPINKDDSKAWRMIESKVKRELTSISR